MNAKELKQNTKELNKAFDKKASIPLLHNIIVKDGYMCVDNLETKVCIPVNIDINFMVDFMRFKKVIDKLKSSDEVSFSLDSNNKLCINVNEKRNFFFNTDSDLFDDFPERKFDNFKSKSLLEKEDVENLKIASKYTKNDEVNEEFSGIYVKDEIVSTDKHRLFRANITNNFNSSFIIRNNVVSLLDNEPSVFQVYERVCKIESSNKIVITRLIDGSFPDFNAVIPKETEYKAEFYTDQLIDVIDNALVQASKEANQVIFEFKDNQNVIIKSQDFVEETEFSEIVKSENNVGFKNIGFDGKYLLSILKDCRDTCATLYMNEPSKPVLINDNFLLMPVVIKDE